jgi:glutathione S-transferase
VVPLLPPRARDVDEHGLDNEIVNVAVAKPRRSDVIELSGQAQVPVIKDGVLVIADSARIIEYLNESYGRQVDSDERSRHEESAAFRAVVQSADPPRRPSTD